MSKALGRLFAVVGPSGVGKDSLLDFARKRLANSKHIHFVQRTITRPAESGGEGHCPLSEDAFEEAEKRGSFAITWRAHGLGYGIPLAVKAFVDSGGIAVVNGSRHALPQLAAVFPNLVVVSVTAHTEVIADRLRQRGRESEPDIQKRLSRDDADYRPFGQVIAIDNSGPLDVAGNQLVALIRSAESANGHVAAQEDAIQTGNAFERYLNGSWLFR